MKMKKKGSALIYVILLLAVLFTVCVGVMEISLGSLRKSANYHNKNSAFYYADNALERIIYYIDLAADDARKRANDYCFLPGGGPNLKTLRIETLYKTYQDELYEIEKDQNKTNADEKKQVALEKFNKKLKEIFVEEYKNNLNNFFNPNNIDDGKLNIKVNGIDNEYNWLTLREVFLNPQLNSNSNVQVNFKRYGEISSGDEFQSFKSESNSSEFENFDTSINSYPRETFYIKVHMNKKNVTRYLIATFELNPFGVDLDKVAVNTGIIRRGYNKLLDYGVATDRNLIVVNGSNIFTVNSDVYVKSTSNNINEIKTSDNFGGILAGIEEETLLKLKNASINPIDASENISEETGKLLIKGNAYVGDILTDRYGDKFTGGFVRTIGNNSEINIDGKLYSHSIITGKNAVNSNITISGDSYIADNTSLNGSNSSINIGGSLIGFETADSNTNYNQSPSIVVNDQTASLSVGKNIILFGVAFIDGVTRVGDNKIFRTVETSSIKPNYLAYTYHIEDNNKFDNYYSSYSFNDSITQPDMFDRDKNGTNVSADDGVNFLLQYIKGSITQESIYDNSYNFAYNHNLNKPIISALNMQFNNNDVNNTSYFSALFTANNKVYVRNMPIDDEINIKNVLGQASKNGDSGKYFKANAVNLEMQSKLIAEDGPLQKIKTEFVNKMKLRDKGIENSSGMDSYIDWNQLNNITSGEIVFTNANEKYLIYISKNDISIDLNNYRDFNVLIVSKGNIFLNSIGNSTVTGNIIAKGDIIVKGGNITLNYNKDISKKLMNYFDSNETEKSQLMHKFFSKGITSDETYDTVVTNAFKRNVKTNIKILSRRQIAKQN